jgi:hypothetical protein
LPECAAVELAEYPLLFWIDESTLAPENLHPQLFDIACITRLISGLGPAEGCIVLADSLGRRQRSLRRGNFPRQPVVLLGAAPEIVEQVFEPGSDASNPQSISTTGVHLHVAGPLRVRREVP